MKFSEKIEDVFKKAKVIEFDESSKFVLMSDCHRGTGDLSDGFAKNQDIYFYALKYYYKNKYTYIEIGDGDELWENKKITEIIGCYTNIFFLLSKFYNEKRAYFIYGNHDMIKKKKKYIRKNYCSFSDEKKERRVSLFKNIKFHEALVLKESNNKNKIFLIHGHQGELINDQLWRVSRFLVRYIWKILESYGVKDPTSTAKNYKKKMKLEKRFTEWSKENKVMIVTGHTHRPMFPEVGDIPYFNDGSCVHPRCITAIEIYNSNIQLVKWCITANEEGILTIKREKLTEKKKINEYFKVFKNN